MAKHHYKRVVVQVCKEAPGTMRQGKGYEHHD